MRCVLYIGGVPAVVATIIRYKSCISVGCGRETLRTMREILPYILFTIVVIVCVLSLVWLVIYGYPGSLV
jgi:hypothetical protein